MPVNPKNASRRGFARFANKVPVEMIRPDRNDPVPASATLEDMSQSGALLLCQEAVPDGEWVVLRPDRHGAGYGTEVTAIVERNLTPNESSAKLVLTFPQPLDYSVLALFR